MNKEYRKQVEKERTLLLEPIIRRYHLTLDEVGALSTITPSILKRLVEKLDVEKEAPKPKEIILDKAFIKKTADLLYTIAKNTTSEGKIQPNKMYTVSLVGFQIFNIYGKAAALYDKCRDDNTIPNAEPTTEPTNNTQPTTILKDNL
jgi:hypothetical protein